MGSDAFAVNLVDASQCDRLRSVVDKIACDFGGWLLRRRYVDQSASATQFSAMMVWTNARCPVRPTRRRIAPQQCPATTPGSLRSRRTRLGGQPLSEALREGGEVGIASGKPERQHFSDEFDVVRDMSVGTRRLPLVVMYCIAPQTDVGHSRPCEPSMYCVPVLTRTWAAVFLLRQGLCVVERSRSELGASASV